MALTIKDPKIIERGPYCVVSGYVVCREDSEPRGKRPSHLTIGGGRSGTVKGTQCWHSSINPNRDDTAVTEDLRSCFTGRGRQGSKSGAWSRKLVSTQKRERSAVDGCSHRRWESKSQTPSSSGLRPVMTDAWEGLHAAI